MRNINKIIAFGAISLSFASSSVFAADATGNASAQIQTAVSVVENTTMNFGSTAVDASGGTVSMTSGGLVTGPGGYTFSGSPAAGAFTVTADASTAVTISFTDGTLTGPGTAMVLNNFTHDAGGTPTTGAGGSLAFAVGGDMVVNATQTSGAYTGTYTVTVNY
ncbi:MAG: DUF4402 domain-containing protein [Halopseudomonas aestusnigri]